MSAARVDTRPQVGIFVFPQVDLLDATGPAEVFTAVNQATEQPGFAVQLVSFSMNPILTTAGVRLLPDLTDREAGALDVLVLPGGAGSRAVADDEDACERLRALSSRAARVMSVCTGARLLAALGLLGGCAVTTHYSAREELAARAPEARIEPDRRYTDNGRILTSAGVTAGLDLSLHLVAAHFGEPAAEATATYLAHGWQREQHDL